MENSDTNSHDDPPTPDLSRIVIATGNPHKVEELRAMLDLPTHHGRGTPGPTRIEFIGLKDLPGHEGFIEPEETGTTIEQNATIKAVSYAEQTGLPCLADDSGLEVDALGGSPGVISSHYCTDGRETGMTRAERDEANNEKLLRALDGVEPDRRTARFVCVMVLAARGTGFQPVSRGTGFQPVSRGTGFQPVPLRPIPANMSPLNQHQRGTLHKSQGDLPHWHQDGATYFVTFRIQQGSLSPQERDVVLKSCLHWHRQRALIHLVVVMPDHVHLLLSPLPKLTGWHGLPDIMHSIKSFTANLINRMRETRTPLWQPEYYDRIIRDADEFNETWDYMLKNPTAAGLVSHWMDYLWTRGGEQERHRLEAGPTGQAITRGTFEGRIGLPNDVPRGDNGFGYDPLLLVAPEFVRTSAELEPNEKNRMSHRGDAAVKMLDALRALTTRGLESPPH